MKAWIAVALLVGLFGLVTSFNNINIDGTCTIVSRCMQCLSRRSRDIERCQQLYFYVTYTTTGNQVEIDRYCNGDCPAVLATANYYCGATEAANELLRVCPSYSVEPTGSFNAPYDTSCLATNGRCLHCLGRDNREATRCLQLYLLATASNHTSKFDNLYCEGNCPSLLSSYGYYCSVSSLPTMAYNYCQRNEEDYCGHVAGQFGSQLSEAAANCSVAECNSDACTAAINEYGCCLRWTTGNDCPRISNCTLPVKVETYDFNVDDECPVSQCSPCLERSSDKLEQCQQTYSYLEYLDQTTAADVGTNVQGTFMDSIKQDFCRGECPILLLTSDYYCGQSGRILFNVCPNYSVVPTASVDVMAGYGRNQNCPIQQTCEECIGSRSPESIRCLQLLLLSAHPNQTDYYLNRYCPGNCPLTLATSEWYCNTASPTQVIFERCMRRSDGGNTDFCASLIDTNPSNFDTAIDTCSQDCTSNNCTTAINNYGCCLNMDTTVAMNCNIPDCNIMTAGAPKILATPLILVVLSALAYHFTY